MSLRLNACRAIAFACACLAGAAAAPPPGPDPQAPGPGKPAEAEAAVAESERLFEAGKYLQARDNATRALTLFEAARDERGIGRATYVLGSVADMTGERAAAQPFFVRAIAAFETAGDRRGRAMSTLGLLRVREQPSAEQEILFERTAGDAFEVRDEGLLCNTFRAWGNHFFTAGRHERALEKLEQALAHCKAGGDPVSLGTVHNSLGRLYRAHGRLDMAISEQLQALALHEKSSSPFNHLQSLNAVAVTYEALGDSKRARVYAERALALAERSESVRVQDFVRANFAGILIDLGDYAEGARQLELVIQHGVDSYPALRYSDLSHAYQKLDRREDSLKAAHFAVERCQRSRGNECVNALERRAKAHAVAGNHAAAVADLEAALDAIEDKRARLVPSDFLKQQFTQSQEEVYSSTIEMQVSDRQPRQALETAEFARSRAFLDLLAASGVAPSVSAPTGASGSAAADLPLVFRGAPALRSPASARPPDAPALAGIARRVNSTMLLYWVADDAVFIWVVKSDGDVRSAQTVIERSKLLDLIRATSPFPSDSALALDRSSAWRQLYDALVRPIRTALPRSGALLTIVPHGPLSGLSFAALLSERGRYLVEDYALHYVPAAGVLEFTQGKRRPDARASNVLLVADPSLGSRSRLDRPLPPLPGARAEARAVAMVVPGARAVIIEGSDATEATVRRTAGANGVLHFATHAIVKDDDPFGSFLALGPTSAETAADGLLTASEIYGLSLNADLVVLSACRSGGGSVIGDGIATFARAFIYAGTASVVTSLWEVADEPTNRLLPAFYRSWLRGASKASALRSAQLQFLRELRSGRVQVSTPAGIVSLPEHPVFWAGFGLVGEPD
jgi:CHAT domain-containing protein